MKPYRFFVILFLLALSAAQVFAQEYFRIGTGGLAAGAYYPVSIELARAIARHGVQARALPSNGSVSNVIGIGDRSIESGLVQADLAAAAYRGDGVFTGKGRVMDLRVVANLFPESIHFIVSRRSGIKSVDGVKGKRISLDEVGSGTLVVARQLLKAYGVEEADFQAEFLKPGQAAERLAAGAIDGMFVVAGRPLPCVSEVVNNGTEIDLIPIDGSGAERFLSANPFYFPDVVASGAYKGVGETKTLSVNAQWIVHKSVNETLIYQIVRDLDSPQVQAALAKQASGIRILAPSAGIESAGVPVHPGAQRYYAEIVGRR